MPESPKALSRAGPFGRSRPLPAGRRNSGVEPETQCGDSSARRGHLERVLRIYVDHYQRCQHIQLTTGEAACLTN